MLDILMVTYNSERWIESCFASIRRSHYDLRKVSVYVVDNCSSDGTMRALERSRKAYAGDFATFEIRQNEKNVGFGAANNIAAAMGSGEYLLCLNIDTEMFDDTLSALMEAIQEDGGETGIWELMQYPYEHPKLYNPVTGETTWASGACFAMRRVLFEKIGGFDAYIFMYAEDVDLSWRARLEGYAIRYVPRAGLVHHSYAAPNEVKPTQYLYSLAHNLVLRLKFGGFVDVAVCMARTARMLVLGRLAVGSRRDMLRALGRTLPAYGHAIAWRMRNGNKIRSGEFTFHGWDYEIAREGAFYEAERLTDGPKVSILVRTCARPDTLRETLLSLRAQIYGNMEIVVVEDGPDCASQMIRKEFPDMNIVYRATGERRGRSAAGNLAMELATGEYFNFLDDDDLFFADHVQTLTAALQRHPEYKVAYSYAFDTPINVRSRAPYRYDVKAYHSTVKERFNRLRLLHHNLFPIQAVMFSREIWERLGGLDSALDMLEDWDMWVRYAAQYDFLCVEKTTSIYRVPASADVSAQRQKALDGALRSVRSKHEGYGVGWTMAQIQRDAIEIIEHGESVNLRARAKAKIRRLLCGN